MPKVREPVTEHRTILVSSMKHVFLAFVSNREARLWHHDSHALFHTSVDLLRPVLEGYACQARLCALGTISAILMKHAWVDHAKHSMLQILLLVATGAMLTRSALFTKNAQSIIAYDANLVNV